MQSWCECCEKCVCLQGDYAEKWLHFQLPMVSSLFLNKLGDLRTWTPHVTRRSAFFELSHPRTHIFHFHNAITACLTQLSMNFDWFHATQVEESDNHPLFFECNVAISVWKTLLQLDLVTSIQRVVQCCQLASPNLKNSHVSSNNFHVSICFHSREKN